MSFHVSDSVICGIMRNYVLLLFLTIPQKAKSIVLNLSRLVQELSNICKLHQQNESVGPYQNVL